MVRRTSENESPAALADVPKLWLITLWMMGPCVGLNNLFRVNLCFNGPLKFQTSLFYCSFLLFSFAEYVVSHNNFVRFWIFSKTKMRQQHDHVQCTVRYNYCFVQNSSRYVQVVYNTCIDNPQHNHPLA